MPSWRLWFNLEYVTATVQLNSNIVQTPKTISKPLITFPTAPLLFLSCHHSQHKLTSTRKPYHLLSTLRAQHQHPALISLPYTYRFFLVCSSPLHSPADPSFRTQLLETVPTSLLGPRALIFISVKKHFITSTFMMHVPPTEIGMGYKTQEIMRSALGNFCFYFLLLSLPLMTNVVIFLFPFFFFSYLKDEYRVWHVIDNKGWWDTRKVDRIKEGLPWWLR